MQFILIKLNYYFLTKIKLEIFQLMANYLYSNLQNPITETVSFIRYKYKYMTQIKNKKNTKNTLKCQLSESSKKKIHRTFNCESLTKLKPF